MVNIYGLFAAILWGCCMHSVTTCMIWCRTCRLMMWRDLAWMQWWRTGLALAAGDPKGDRRPMLPDIWIAILCL